VAFILLSSWLAVDKVSAQEDPCEDGPCLHGICVGHAENG